MVNNMLRKGLVLGVIILFVGASFIPSTCGNIGNSNEQNSRQSIVTFNGEVLYVGGSGPGNYSSIQDAIDNASDGDTVFVYDDSSPYYENIVIDKSISLIGENKHTTVIDGSNWRVVHISVDWVNISGFTVQNCGSSTSDAGIYITSNFNIVSDNIVTLNDWVGIWIIGEYSYNTISNNIITNSRIGIIISWGSNNTIYANILSSQIEGIRLASCYSNYLLSNTISLNSLDGIRLFSSNDNYISENYISENWYGLRLWDSNENIIEGNYANSSSYYGISLSQSSNSNQIYHNNFVDNEHSSWDQCSNTWDDGYPSGGNYWDDYDGTDEDGDRIGDTPYDISGGDNQDLYPLMKPYGTPFADFNYYANNRTFDGSLSYDVDGEIIMYEWDFDDGSTGIGKVVTHVYDESATYNVNLTVTDDDGYQDSIMKSIEVEANYAPEAPVINGPQSGEVGGIYSYAFVASDTNGDDVYFSILWGDGSSDEWVGPYESDEIAWVNHSWSAKGTYIIMARAKDVYGETGEWGTLEVTMPKNKVFIFNFPMMSWMYELFPNMFPILRHLLGL